jgi:asparagine synthase (glutamine-hydrolysing)
MCGIYGWLGPDINVGEAERQRDLLSHRGPDDAGSWYDAEAQVWLGHRRLSIFDLSPAGHQPMASASGRYQIVFNGEIFNFLELRSDLETFGHRFDGNSDTEVLLAAVEHWGLAAAVQKFIGMFAFALWDRQTRILTLARDRLGIKPIYYTHSGQHFAFASELRPLARLPWVSDKLDQQAIADYLRYLCVPAPRTALRDIAKLSAGQMLHFSNGRAEIETYWDLGAVVEAGRNSPLNLTFEEAAEEYEARLTDAVALRMRADVPFGSLLSGGVDSSLVTAMMTKVADKPVKTFSIGFEKAANDESQYAKQVANHLGTEHHELILGPDVVPALAAEIGQLHDEPFADGSSLPTLALARFARSHVTVALGGDGGDETFGGYPRYFWADRIAAWQTRLGAGGASLLGKGLAAFPKSFIDGPIDRLTMKRFSGAQKLSSRVERFAEYLGSSPSRVDTHMLAAWANPEHVLLNRDFATKDRLEMWAKLDWPRQMMAVDQKHYLPDDILTKVDRMSMSVGLEARVPLLDHRLVEWSWRVPSNYKFAAKGDRGKLLMRKVLYKHVPQSLIERPKSGFGMPLDSWLRGGLRDWAEAALDPKRIDDSGVLDSAVVRNIWEKHLGGENRLSQIWTVIMLQSWLASMSDLKKTMV